MKHTLGTAAKATGKSKSTISRDIRSGRISANKREDGSYEIDPAELHRVYPPVSHENGTRHTASNDPQPLPATRVTELEVRLEAAEERIRDKDSAIEDLRRRLDASEQERREVSRKLTGLLTDQREKSPQKPVEGRLARAWGILRGKT
jgi:hypothetical protein